MEQLCGHDHMLDAVQFGPFSVFIKQHKVFMMRWCPLTPLRLALTVLLCFSVRGFAEKRLLCSSNTLSFWWEYEGPMVVTSVKFSHCARIETFFVTYTGIPMFTPVQMGWHLNVLYRNNTWVELSTPLTPCEDYKICDLIKGETIHDTFPVFIEEPYYIPSGEYRIIFTVNFIDDFDREITLRAKLTMLLR